MEYVFDLYHLSAKFMNEYPQSQFPEIMCKLDRPYTCLLIDVHIDYFICVPFRTNIRHGNAFLLTKSTRAKNPGGETSQSPSSGLDFSKIIIIRGTDTDYLDYGKHASVNSGEYKDMVRNLPRIVTEAVNYVDTYVGHQNGTAMLQPRQYERKYGHTTLQYFHDILGIKPVNGQ